MINSMTGFASIEQAFEFGRLSWEIRTLNHRYMEIGLRLPEEFRVLEPRIRERIGEVVSRGKFDASLRLSDARAGQGANLALNRDLAQSLLAVQAELGELAGKARKPSLGTLLRWPGLVQEPLPDPEPMRQAALDLLDQALAQLLAMRRREGEAIQAALAERLDGVARWTGQIREWLPEIRAALRTRMSDRVAELAADMDPARLEQEVAILAQKMDVDEELDRLDAHVIEARRTLGRDGPVGRRLDFLMQEFNRESNTLSSKSVDARTSKAAVELKVLIEQMREQVQNAE